MSSARCRGAIGSCGSCSATTSAATGAATSAGRKCGAAMLGHWRPLFLRWQRGGKMVATCGGAFLGVAPVVGGIGAGVWIAVFLVCRYASLASMLAALSLPVVAGLLDEPWPVIAFAGVAAVAVVVLHRTNIARLRSGTESRFRFRRTAQDMP